MRAQMAGRSRRPPVYGSMAGVRLTMLMSAAAAIAGGAAIAHGMVFVGTGAGAFLPGNKLMAFAL